MEAGFWAVGRGDEVEFRVFGRRYADRPPMVTFCRMPHGSAVLLGRLYYRRHLTDELASWRPELPTKGANLCDAALALAAYHRHGLRGVEQLEGDFSVALWDAREGRLVGCRDPMGGYPLFWTAAHGAIALGSSIRPLLGLLTSRSLNLDYLAEFLMLSGPVQELPSEHCAYKGIYRLLPGTTISLQVSTGQVEQRTHWNWQEHLVDSGASRPDELGSQFLEHLRLAVRERIRGRIASHLSGGMDSTTVSLLARDWIHSGAGEGPLHTLSLVYHRLPGLARETFYLESVLPWAGSVAHRIPADDLLDFDGFAAPPPHDEPYAGLFRMAMDRATVEVAAEVGAATMLTGLGADEVLVNSPTHLADLLRRGRLCTAWAEACRWARADGCNPWEILYPHGIANLLPPWSRAGLGALLRRGYASWRGQNDWTIAPWIRSCFARRYELRCRAAENARRTVASCRPIGLSLALAAIESRKGDFNRWFLGAPRGVVIAHPFLDPRVLCLGLSIQSRVVAEPGSGKPVLAEALRGLVPDRLRNRRRKGHYNEIYFLGLARNLQALEAMIRRAPIDDLDLFDKVTLIQCLQKAALGDARNVRALNRFNLTLSLIRWLSSQADWSRVMESPAETIRAGRLGAGGARETALEPVEKGWISVREGQRPSVTSSARERQV
jgi:asparagine synthase (glutamine-hydrolysing)